MAKDDPYRTLYKQWRNFLGLALGAAWIVYWWIRLSGEEAAALAAIPAAHTMLGNLGHWWDTGAVSREYGGYKFYAVISSPLSFVVSRYIARWYVDGQRRAEEARAVRTHEAQLAQQAENLDRMRNVAQSDAEKSQYANERHELVTRIGDVDSQLLLLEAEKDQERRTRMLLNLTQFVYQIHAKFPAEKVAALLAGDDVLPRMIERSMAHMRELGLADRNFYVVLSGMLPSRRAIRADVVADVGQVSAASHAAGALAPR